MPDRVAGRVPAMQHTRLPAPALATVRLVAVAEGTLLTLLECHEDGGSHGRQHLLLTARKEDGRAVLKFVAAPGEGNLEDRMALLGEDAAETPAEQEVSLRLLRHLASSVRHEQYHDTKIVIVRVDTPNKPSDPRTLCGRAPAMRPGLRPSLDGYSPTDHWLRLAKCFPIVFVSLYRLYLYVRSFSTVIR